MDAKRARDIAASPVMVPVEHNGIQIYIEKIINDNSAMVHPIGNSSNHQKVRISNLIEQ